MKPIKVHNIRSLFLLLSISAVSQATFCQENQVKKFIKEYSVNKNTVLQLNNKYGNIDIRDWNKNEISVEVTIILKNISGQRAEQIIEKVTIDFSNEGNVINVSTIYDEEFFKMLNKDQFLQEKKFEVNYLVMMPSNITVEVANKYGDIFISKLVSPSTIQLKYGSLKINQIIAENKDNMAVIEIAYSKGIIEDCSWLKILSKYSQLNIQKSKAIIVISKYSKFNIEEGSTLICESKYDSYDMGILANFVTEAQYSNFRFDEITKKIHLETKYTDVKVGRVPAGFESIDIENSYGSVKIGIDDDASYSLKGFARYAKISYPDNSRMNRVQENNELKIEGTVGKAGKGGTVKINTRYGGISLY